MADLHGVRRSIGASLLGQFVFSQLLRSRQSKWWGWTERCWQLILKWGQFKGWVISLPVRDTTILAPIDDYWIQRWIQKESALSPISQLSLILSGELPSLCIIELGAGVGFWEIACPSTYPPILGIESDFDRFRLLNRNALYIDHFQTECASIDNDATTSAVSIDSDLNPMVTLSISELFHRHPSFQQANWLRIPLLDRVLESIDSILGWAYVQKPIITMQWIHIPTDRLSQLITRLKEAGYTRSLWVGDTVMMGIELSHTSLIDDLILGPRSKMGWIVHIFPPTYAHIADLLRGHWRAQGI